MREDAAELITKIRALKKSCRGSLINYKAEGKKKKRGGGRGWKSGSASDLEIKVEGKPAHWQKLFKINVIKKRRACRERLYKNVREEIL